MTPPPLRKFSENSSNLVQVVFPIETTVLFSDLSLFAFINDPNLKEIGEVPDILTTSKVFWDKVFHSPLVAK